MTVTRPHVFVGRSLLGAWPAWLAGCLGRLYDGTRICGSSLLAAATWHLLHAAGAGGPARFRPGLPWAASRRFGGGLRMLDWASFDTPRSSLPRPGYRPGGIRLFSADRTPFVGGAALREPERLAGSYPALFELSWRIFVRYRRGACLFTACSGDSVAVGCPARARGARPARPPDLARPRRWPGC